MAEYVNVKQFCSGPIIEFGDIEGMPGKRWKLGKPKETDRYKLKRAVDAHTARIKAKTEELAARANERREAEEARLRADEAQVEAWQAEERERLAGGYEGEALEDAVTKAVDRRVLDASEDAGRVYLDEVDGEDMFPVEFDWERMGPAIKLSLYLTPDTDPVEIARHFDLEWIQHCLALVDEVKSGVAAKKALSGQGPLPKRS